MSSMFCFIDWMWSFASMSELRATAFLGICTCKNLISAACSNLCCLCRCKKAILRIAIPMIQRKAVAIQLIRRYIKISVMVSEDSSRYKVLTLLYFFCLELQFLPASKLFFEKKQLDFFFGLDIVKTHQKINIYEINRKRILLQNGGA